MVTAYHHNRVMINDHKILGNFHYNNYNYFIETISFLTLVIIHEYLSLGLINFLNTFSHIFSLNKLYQNFVLKILKNHKNGMKIEKLGLMRIFSFYLEFFLNINFQY